MASARSAGTQSRNANWLIAGFIAAVLLLLITVPSVLTYHAGAIISEVNDSADPADELTARIQASLTHEESAIIGMQATGEDKYQDLYRQAVETIASAIAELTPLTLKVGSTAQGGLAHVRSTTDQWHQAVAKNHLIDMQLPAEQFRELFFQREYLLEQAEEAAVELRASIVDWRRAERARIGWITRLWPILSIGFAVLAIVALFIVLKLLRRVSATTSFMASRANDEEALRKVAHSLTAALTLEDVLRRITQTASEASDAESVYIETVNPAADEVTCVAGYGPGLPPTGTKGAYNGSLAKEVLQTGEPRIIEEVVAESERHSVFGELAKSCANCTAMVLPLISDGEPFGALFLIRRHPRVFTEAEFPNVRILADMASLALHRTLTVERLRGTIEVRDRAIQARDEVLRVVSHDLRNPINNIQMTVQALANPSIPEDKRRTLFDILSRAAERMNRLIDDLIAVARLREGQKIPLALRAENPASIIHDACGQFVVQAESKSLRLACDEHTILPTVKADRHRILQVLSNLIDNAIKFTPEGGTITLSCEPFEGSVRFMVRDTGRGIEERFLDRIFDLFWQAKPTAHMGSGLGLAIAKSIVEQHGGRMWVESKPGLGTTFYFTLLQAAGSIEEEKVS